MAAQLVRTRRDFLIQTFNTGIWLSISSTALIGPLIKAMAEVPNELPLGQSIHDFSGEVTVDNEAITDENMKKTLVKANSTIITGATSWIIFAVGKDAHFLRENSRLTLEGDGFLEQAMRLLTGTVLSVFAARKEKKEDYKVHTSTATIGIRGTGLYAESEPSKNRSYICTCYGDVNIRSIVDPSVNENIKTSHHDDPRYVYGQGHQGMLIQPAPFKNHTDAELQLLETIVGRNTPFSSVKEAYPRPRKGY